MRLLLPAAIAIGLTAAAAITFARSGESSAGHLAVASAWARATPPGANVGAAYVTVANNGASEDRLLGAASPAAQSVSLHESLEENGIAIMRPLQSAAIPARGALEMRPGGTHLMLMELRAPLKVGESISLTLQFRDAGEVVIEVPVAPIGATAPEDQHGDHPM